MRIGRSIGFRQHTAAGRQNPTPRTRTLLENLLGKAEIGSFYFWSMSYFLPWSRKWSSCPPLAPAPAFRLPPSRRRDSEEEESQSKTKIGRLWDSLLLLLPDLKGISTQAFIVPLHFEAGEERNRTKGRVLLSVSSSVAFVYKVLFFFFLFISFLVCPILFQKVDFYNHDEAKRRGPEGGKERKFE